MKPPEDDLIFNVVWTGTVFTYLHLFVASQMAHTSARYRFVVNGCPPDQVELMERFRSRHPDQVVEVLEVSAEMIAHGVALDRVRAVRDDGDHFSLIDPDIKANGPWVADLTSLLNGDVVAVTSGKEVWTDDNLVPVDHPGVAGEHFFDRSGFVFGSPHLGIYRQDALQETVDRWGVGFGFAGPDLSPAARDAMASMGHDYLVYDTSKIVNALIQHGGRARLVHRDIPQLVHIGGLAHYLSPPGYRVNDEGEEEPDWTKYESMTVRHEITRYTARTLRALCDGDPAPDVPADLPEALEDRLRRVRMEIEELVALYA